MRFCKRKICFANAIPNFELLFLFFSWNKKKSNRNVIIKTDGKSNLINQANTIWFGTLNYDLLYTTLYRCKIKITKTIKFWSKIMNGIRDTELSTWRNGYTCRWVKVTFDRDFTFSDSAIDFDWLIDRIEISSCCSECQSNSSNMFRFCFMWKSLGKQYVSEFGKILEINYLIKI